MNGKGMTATAVMDLVQTTVPDAEVIDAVAGGCVLVRVELADGRYLGIGAGMNPFDGHDVASDRIGIDVYPNSDAYDNGRPEGPALAFDAWPDDLRWWLQLLVDGVVGRITKARLDTIVERIKREVIADILDDTVPATVKTFSELHDYVDANTYGGLCEENRDIVHFESDSLTAEAVFTFANYVQDQVHDWLQAGRETTATNGRWLTAGEIVDHLSRYPRDMPVTARTPDDGWWLNLITLSDPTEGDEHSIIIDTRDNFDPRQW